MIVYTVGHSTRSIDQFVELIEAYGITLLVDVRTVPRSRHTPQFNLGELDVALGEHGIRYRHMAELGGLRHTHKDSTNTGWHNASFRGFADYMQTPEFAAGIEQLVELATHRQTAIMCAEAVPWRCHRSLIGDALLVHGSEVRDIMDASHARPETITDFAMVHGTDIHYPTQGTPTKPARTLRWRSSRTTA